MEEAGKPITRRDLPAVVRRAAELAAVDDDAGDQIAEDEVVRIAAELGIAPRHVKQALYEGVREDEEPRFLDRQLGTPRLAASRAVPLDAARALKIVEEYLVTSEYLTVVRRQGNSLTLEPAPDTVSRIARSFKRGSKHLLASAEIVEVTVRPLEDGWSHVRLRTIYEDKRRSKVAGAIVGGVFLGTPVAGLTAAIVGGIGSNLLGGLGDPGHVVAVTAAVMTGVATFSGVMAGMLASTRKRYRQWRERTVMQTEGVLDKLEKGKDLRPPPPPWIQKLQMKLNQL
jgi:hypothetical protein